MRLYKCPWKTGDVFAYQLESDMAKERGLYGHYLLIQKVDEGVWYPGHIVPIVYIKITKDNELPTNLDEYNKLEYVQTRSAKYEERLFPIDGRRPLEDIAEKSKIRYEVDEFGFLPIFRVKLISESNKEIPPTLFQVGNFENATPQQKEFVPQSKFNIPSVLWKNFNHTFESVVLTRYFQFNLRESKIYSIPSN